MKKIVIELTETEMEALEKVAADTHADNLGEAMKLATLSFAATLERGFFCKKCYNTKDTQATPA